MPLNLTDASLDWALLNAENFGDTDIFPNVFEFSAIRYDWDTVKAAIKAEDLLNWTVRAQPYFLRAKASIRLPFIDTARSI
jgi:hypothetical protein